MFKGSSHAQVNVQDRFTHTPLWDAIERMDKEAAITLRKHGATVQDGVATTLCEQAKLNNVNLFELLHSVQCDIYCRVSALSYNALGGWAMKLAVFFPGLDVAAAYIS